MHEHRLKSSEKGLKSAWEAYGIVWEVDDVGRLKRWMPKVGLRKSPNGDLWLEAYRLFAFRVYRALEAVAFLIDQGGEVPFAWRLRLKTCAGRAQRAHGAPLSASGAAER